MFLLLAEYLIEVNTPIQTRQCCLNHLFNAKHCSVCSVGGDDFLVVHARDDFAALHGTTPYTHSCPGTPINMPWLGGLQTGRGASVVSPQHIYSV